jgi:para-aminobenzoate synthetase component 1
VDLLGAAFPGGSITGAPKERAMQIIAGIEQSPRGVYCGSIGYMGANGSALLNIAIRTMTVNNGVATFSAGGGVVLDSQPGAEYEETLAKASGLIATITASAGLS